MTLNDVPNYVPAVVVDQLGSLRVLLRIDDFVFTVNKDGRSILPVPCFPKDYELTELPVFAKAFSQDTPQP